MNPPCLDATRRRWLQRLLQRLLAGPAAAVLAACGDSGSQAPAAPTRTWRMGFSALPPRLTINDILRNIDLWSQRADLAIIHEELPWTDLLASMSADAILLRDKTDLADTPRAFRY